jgi:hypothetical protein
MSVIGNRPFHELSLMCMKNGVLSKVTSQLRRLAGSGVIAKSRVNTESGSFNPAAATFS